ncbi:MAG TPA: hypothetical protein VJU14_03850 [Solirubrobacterales bacterium]|nr:hypothetical protein [Solirubrobacterales bacterium]
MRSFKKLVVLAVVFALSAIGAASASAAQFTASSTGELSGRGSLSHTFKFTGGNVSCLTTKINGTIAKTASTEQHVTVNYSGCTAFGFASVHITPATYNLTASGTYHITNTITMTVTGAGCSITIGPQSRGSVVYSSLPGGYLQANFYVSGLSYTSTGGLCGSSGLGFYDGWTESHRVGGGSLSYDF